MTDQTPWLTSATAKIGTLHDGQDVVVLAQDVARIQPNQARYWAEASPATPWCGVFVAHELVINGVVVPGPRSDGVGPMYVDWWLDFGTEVTVGQEQPGDIALWLGSPHHVSFVDGNQQYIGGNQSDGVTRAHFRTPDAIRRSPAPSAIVVAAPLAYPEIELGATGPAVIELQRLLGITQSGVFDDITDVAVRAFQASHGLGVDGVVGYPQTWPALLGTIDDVKYSVEYADQWRRMVILPEKATAVDSIAHKLLANKARYQAVQVRTGVPWAVIAVLHNRESDADFNTQLAQGDPLNHVSTNVPAGRGPFPTWEDGAYDALVTLSHLDQVKNWSIERVCYECERYNGWGYRNKGVPSAYLWSFSNIYQGGKFIADGVWSATAQDQQCGTLPTLKRMMEIDTSIQFGVTGVVMPPIKLDDDLLNLVFVLSQEGSTMDANLQAQIIAEIRKANPADKALLLQALSAVTGTTQTLPGPVVQPPPFGGIDLSQIGVLLQSPVVQQILSGKSITINDLLTLLPALLAMLQGHPVASVLPTPVDPTDTTPSQPIVPPASNTAFNWSAGIGAALTALLGSASGVIGTPIPGGADFSMTGLLSFGLPLIAGAFGIPAPLVNGITSLFSKFKRL